MLGTVLSIAASAVASQSVSVVVKRVLVKVALSTEGLGVLESALFKVGTVVIPYIAMAKTTDFVLETIDVGKKAYTRQKDKIQSKIESSKK